MRRRARQGDDEDDDEHDEHDREPYDEANEPADCEAGADAIHLLAVRQPQELTDAGGRTTPRGELGESDSGSSTGILAERQP